MCFSSKRTNVLFLLIMKNYFFQVSWDICSMRLVCESAQHDRCQIRDMGDSDGGYLCVWE